MGAEILTVIFGLTAAASFGAGDFCGGVATRRNNVYSVVAVSQFIGIVLLFGLVLYLREQVPSPGTLVLGGTAGIFGVIGLMGLYSSLAGGRMGIVAPVTAVVSVVFPIIVGMFIEGMPSTMHIAGLGIAAVAIWLLTRDASGEPLRLSELGVPIIAGLAFGMFFILIDRVCASAILWPLVAARLASISMLLLIMLLSRKGGMPAANQLLVIVLAGIFDTGGNIFFAVAARFGRLDIATILSSLYPASTVVLAWFVLKERLVLRQWAGVIAALVAIGFIAS